MIFNKTQGNILFAMLKVSMFLFINFLNSIAYNNIILKQKTIKKPSYLTGFIYFILSLPLINLENNVVILISSFLLINLYGNIINLHQSNEIKKTILKISFFLACLLIIDFQLIYYCLSKSEADTCASTNFSTLFSMNSNYCDYNHFIGNQTSES